MPLSPLTPSPPPPLGQACPWLYELVGPLGAVLKLESLLDAETRTRTAIVRFRSVRSAGLTDGTQPAGASAL